MTIVSERTGIKLILLVALAVRLIWAGIQPSTDEAIDRLPDQREYLSLGGSLLHDGMLGFVDERFEQVVYAYRTPGYPVFIAMMGGSPGVVRLVQGVIDTSTVLAVYLLAWQFWKRSGPALWAAAIVAVNPFLVYFCGLILSETVFTALLVWGMLLLVRRRIVAGSVLFLLAVLVRPSAILLAPCIAIGAALLNPGGGRSYPLRQAATVLSVMVIGLTPWCFRNHLILESWVWTTTNSGITLYDGFNPAATGNSDQRFLSQMPELRSMNEVQRSVYLRNSAWKWISEHPAELAGLTVKKIARTWSPVPLSDEYSRPLYRWTSAMYAVPFDILALIGIFSPVLNRRVKAMLMVPAIYFTLVHGMSVGSLRYRVVVEPELAVVAASGVIAFSRKRSFPTA